VSEALSEVPEAKSRFWPWFSASDGANCVPWAPTPAHPYRAGQYEMSSRRASILAPQIDSGLGTP